MIFDRWHRRDIDAGLGQRPAGRQCAFASGRFIHFSALGGDEGLRPHFASCGGTFQAREDAGARRAGCFTRHGADARRFFAGRRKPTKPAAPVFCWSDFPKLRGAPACRSIWPKWAQALVEFIV